MSLINPPANITDLIAAATEAAQHINRQHEAIRQISAEIAAQPGQRPAGEVTK